MHAYLIVPHRLSTGAIKLTSMNYLFACRAALVASTTSLIATSNINQQGHCDSQHNSQVGIESWLPAGGSGNVQYMDAFGWSTQPPVTTVPSCPTDDALLAAFLGAGSFEELHSAGAGDGTVCSDAYHGGLDLPSCQSDLSLLRCQDGVALPGHGDASSNVFLGSAGGFLPAIAGQHDGLHDRFAFVPDDPAQAAGSHTAFSGYSTTTG
uniref:Uncharacterized protein n=1 Tax=Aegilops tauschii subsp. strangulata TaxID=200361 RepID=A0A452ZQ27_AEGTS